MSQTESPSERLRQQRRELLLDLAKQAEARKLQVKQMLAQCAGERDKEAERQRVVRRDTLQKISTEVREIRESTTKAEPVAEAPAVVLKPVVAALASTAPQPKAVSPQPVAAPPLPAAAAPLPAAAPRPSPAPAPSPTAAPNLTAAPSPAAAHSPVPAASPTPASVVVDPAFESRMSGLEDAFAKLVQTVTEKLDYSTRIHHVESQAKALHKAIEELGTRFSPIESRFDVLRNDLRAVESGNDRLADQIKSFDQMFASLGRDSQKLSSLVDSLGSEIRQVEARSNAFEQNQSTILAEKFGEMTTLQDRLTRLESGLVRAIGLLQSSEQGIADLSNLRERFQDMETGFQRVIKAVESLQRAPEPTDTAAEREATANVLASLTKLVQGMRAAQNERQIQQGVKPA